MSGELKYGYHVVYIFSDGDKRGTGSIDLRRSYKFRSTEDVNSSKKYLEEEYGYHNVVILSWQAYETETWFSKLIGIF